MSAITPGSVKLDWTLFFKDHRSLELSDGININLAHSSIAIAVFWKLAFLLRWSSSVFGTYWRQILEFIIVGYVSVHSDHMYMDINILCVRHDPRTPRWVISASIWIQVSQCVQFKWRWFMYRSSTRYISLWNTLEFIFLSLIMLVMLITSSPLFKKFILRRNVFPPMGCLFWKIDKVY